MLERFKQILSKEGLDGKVFCEQLKGLTYGSYRTMTGSGKRGVPKWVRSFVIGYELGKLSKEK